MLATASQLVLQLNGPSMTSGVIGAASKLRRSSRTRTVFQGEEPAREVVHDSNNGWAVGDGVKDPNEPGAVVVGL